MNMWRAGHVARMELLRNTYKICDKLECIRFFEILSRRRKDNFEVDHKLQGVNSIHMAQDWVQQRNLANTVIHPRVS
jgi:hypothetical protein